MKTVFTLALVAVSFLFGNAQITLEHTYTEPNISVAKVSATEDVFYNTPTTGSNSVNIYSVNHSLLKTINVNAPSGYKFFYVNFVSRDLFNTDNGFEFVAGYLNDGGTFAERFQVIDENGNVLLDIDSTFSPGIYNTSAGTKMVAQGSDHSNPSNVKSLVYSLPGTYNYVFSTGVADHNGQPVKLPGSWPNPANGIIHLPYNLPDHVTQAKLEVFGVDGRQLNNYIIDNHFSDLLYDATPLPQGVYTYTINGQYAGKFVKE